MKGVLCGTEAVGYDMLEGSAGYLLEDLERKVSSFSPSPLAHEARGTYFISEGKGGYKEKEVKNSIVLV